MSARTVGRQLYNDFTLMADPGSGGSLVVDRTPAVVHITSGGAEARTLSRPTARGGTVIFNAIPTLTGTVTITVTGGYNPDGDTTFALTTAGQWVKFESTHDGTSYVWVKTGDYNIGNLTATEAGWLNAITPGTITASKAVVVDSNKDASAFRNVRATRLLEAQGDATFDNTAGPLSLSAAMLLGGTLLRDPNGSSRTDVLPAASAIVAALPGAAVGDIIALYVVNCADAAEVITMSAGAGGTWKVTQIAASRIVGQNASRMVYVRLTNVTAASEAYDAWM